MKRRIFLAALLLTVANLQTAWGQGFRVYQSDGTELQFSLKTDSIVFDNGLSGDEVFGPFTPVNLCIAKTWYMSNSEAVTFNADGTTDYIAGGTYEFMPYQGNVIIYNASAAPTNILKVYKVTAEKMIVGSPDGCNLSVWSSTKSEPADEYEWVDLGLPSGTLWATCNVGASSPEEYGDYFAWGETEPKSEYNWGTYKYCYGYYNTLTRYCLQSSYGYNGFTDTLTELLPEDDAATANWGSGWQMPSQDQLEELYNSSFVTTTWTIQNGVKGRKIVSKSNGNSIFLPAAGHRDDMELINTGSEGDYWSLSLDTSYLNYACRLGFNLSAIRVGRSLRTYGRNVRPVRVQE